MINKTEWSRIRSKIIRRDAYRCRVIDCTVKGAQNLTVHHIVPRDEGGDNRDANLITLCPKHHDEIEIAGLRVIQLIEAWESDQANGQNVASRTILDDAAGDYYDRRKPGRTVHLCDDKTVAAVVKIKNETKRAWTDIAKQLGYPASFAATLSAISKDKPGAISEEGEYELRERIADTQIDALLPADRQELLVKTWKKNEEPDTGAWRRATEATKAQIAALGAKPAKPAWLKLAIRDALHDKPMSTERERRMCVALGIDAPPNEYAVPECPGCGGAPHVANDGCNGHPVAAVVVLAPGETVRRPGQSRQRRRYWRPCLSADLAPQQREQVLEFAAQLAGLEPGTKGDQP